MEATLDGRNRPLVSCACTSPSSFSPNPDPALESLLVASRLHSRNRLCVFASPSCAVPSEPLVELNLRLLLLHPAFHDPSWSKAACQRYVLYPEILKIFTATAVGSMFLSIFIVQMKTDQSGWCSHLYFTIILYLLKEQAHSLHIHPITRRGTCSQDCQCFPSVYL